MTRNDVKPLAIASVLWGRPRLDRPGVNSGSCRPLGREVQARAHAARRCSAARRVGSALWYQGLELGRQDVEWEIAQCSASGSGTVDRDGVKPLMAAGSVPRSVVAFAEGQWWPAPCDPRWDIGFNVVEWVRVQLINREGDWVMPIVAQPCLHSEQWPQNVRARSYVEAVASDSGVRKIWNSPEPLNPSPPGASASRRVYLSRQGGREFEVTLLSFTVDDTPSNRLWVNSSCVSTSTALRMRCFEVSRPGARFCRAVPASRLRAAEALMAMPSRWSTTVGELRACRSATYAQAGQGQLAPRAATETGDTQDTRTVCTAETQLFDDQPGCRRGALRARHEPRLPPPEDGEPVPPSPIHHCVLLSIDLRAVLVVNEEGQLVLHAEQYDQAAVLVCMVDDVERRHPVVADAELFRHLYRPRFQHGPQRLLQLHPVGSCECHGRRRGGCSLVGGTQLPQVRKVGVAGNLPRTAAHSALEDSHLVLLQFCGAAHREPQPVLPAVQQQGPPLRPPADAGPSGATAVERGLAYRPGQGAQHRVKRLAPSLPRRVGRLRRKRYRLADQVVIRWLSVELLSKSRYVADVGHACLRYVHSKTVYHMPHKLTFRHIYYEIFDLDAETVRVKDEHVSTPAASEVITSAGIVQEGDPRLHRVALRSAHGPSGDEGLGLGLDDALALERREALLASAGPAGPRPHTDVIPVKRWRLTHVLAALQVRGRAGQPRPQGGEKDLRVDRDYPLLHLRGVDEMKPASSPAGVRTAAISPSVRVPPSRM